MRDENETCTIYILRTKTIFLSNSIFTLAKTRSFCDYNNNIHRHKFLYTEIYTLSYNLIITRLLDTVATLEISFKVVIKKFKLPQYFS